MSRAVIAYLPWLLSAVTIWMTLLAGNKHRYAWAVGLGNQGLWLVWIVLSATWGLIPMNIALWAVYALSSQEEIGGLIATASKVAASMGAVFTPDEAKVAALSSQGSVGDGSESVAYDRAKVKSGDVVWVKGVASDVCTSCCFVRIDTIHQGRQIGDYIKPENIRLNTPAPSPVAEGEGPVLVCPKCEGEGHYADGVDEAACSEACERSAGNGWVSDLRNVPSAVEAIWDDINGRRGFDLRDLDEDVQQEIRSTWAALILAALSAARTGGVA